jgi:AcrR family transcriptional regulator
VARPQLADHPLPARQARSRRTTERITAAALALLERKTFAQLTVAEIARKAGVSVGGFYGRFRSKDALLQYFDVTVIEGILERARRELDSERLAGAGARDVVSTYVELAVRMFREHRQVLQQVALRSRTSRDPAFRERIRAANRFLHGRFRALLEERRAEIGHPEPARAIDLGLTFVSAAMREYVLFAEFRPDFAPIPDRGLVRELTDAFCAYLQIAPRRKRGHRS